MFTVVFYLMNGDVFQAQEVKIAFARDKISSDMYPRYALPERTPNVGIKGTNIILAFV